VTGIKSHSFTIFEIVGPAGIHGLMDGDTHSTQSSQLFSVKFLNRAILIPKYPIFVNIKEAHELNTSMQHSRCPCCQVDL
jgi:hypothetical protein